MTSVSINVSKVSKSVVRGVGYGVGRGLGDEVDSI